MTKNLDELFSVMGDAVIRTFFYLKTKFMYIHKWPK
jgi:hypothetical protein